MRKRRKRVLVGALFGLGLLAWYLGFVPIASGPGRSGLRHALSLTVLPGSLRVESSRGEMWTDYIFEADFRIAPSDIDQLLSGREFSQSPALSPAENTDPMFLRDHVPFLIAESWSWSDVPADLQEGDHGTHCSICFNGSRDRAYLRYTAD